MKFLITVSILIFVVGLNAQSFEELIQKADKLYYAKDYQGSADVYKTAFALKEGSTGEYYNAACSWSLTGDTLTSMDYLVKATEKGLNNLKHVKSDSDLKTLHTTQKWQDVLAKVQANKEEYEKDFDKPLQQRLENVLVKDQMIRRLMPDAQERFGNDSEEMKYFFQLMSEQDRINEKEVLALIDEEGWVGKSKVGDQANMAIWLVVQHAPLETQEKYLPLLKESVKNGESQGRHLALLEDRIQMRNGKPQIYGSQIRTNSETGEKEVYEVIDPEYVNQRRKEVGLGPIETYVMRWDIEWTIEQMER